MHRENRPVFAQPDHLAPDADDPGPASTEVIRQVAIMLASIWRRHEQTHVAANHLTRLVTEKPFGCRVERFDNTALVNGDDALDGGFQNGAQPLLAVPEGGLGELERRGHCAAGRRAGRAGLRELRLISHESECMAFGAGLTRKYAFLGVTHAASFNWPRYSVGDWPRIFLNTRLKCVRD